jgi:hypothetical protein
MVDVTRRERLCKWLSLLDCDISVLTGLIPDITLIVADYVVSLEHLWNALPPRLRRKTCACASMPSNNFTWCRCFDEISQHICTIHTLGKARATEFSIKISSIDGYRWWLGILWSTSADGFQRPGSYTSNDSFDGIDGGLDSLILSYDGRIQRFGKFGYYSEALIPWSNMSTSPLVTIRITNAEDASSTKSFIEFDTNEGYAPAEIEIDHWQEARPFVQFDRYNYLDPAQTSLSSPLPISCTIQTPLFSPT